jgi:hypothetical protein
MLRCVGFSGISDSKRFQYFPGFYLTYVQGGEKNREEKEGFLCPMDQITIKTPNPTGRLFLKDL